MKEIKWVTRRTGGGKRPYSRAYASRGAAMADAERALELGRDYTVTRRESDASVVAEEPRPNRGTQTPQAETSDD